MAFLGSAVRRIRAEVSEQLGLYARMRSRLDGTRAAILMYHRVLPDERALELAVEPGMYVTPETFARHLDWLCERFCVLSLGELANRLEAGAPLPLQSCAITFDDGWRDNWQYVLPALRRRSLPATVFVVAERMDSLGAFWPDEVSRRFRALEPEQQRSLAACFGLEKARNPAQETLARFKGYSEEQRDEALARMREFTKNLDLPQERELMTWQEADQMAAGGVEIESHGLTHALMTGIPSDRLERELRESRRILREHGHGLRGFLAYPNGNHDRSVRTLARECGYGLAVTTERGLAHAETPRMALPRLGLHQDISGSRAEFHRIVPGSGVHRGRPGPPRRPTNRSRRRS